MALSRIAVVSLLFVFLGPLSAEVQLGTGKTGTWGAKQTQLANSYLNMLSQDPDYGSVVDLIWDLYEKHDASELLLNNIAAQAEAGSFLSPKIVLGHLLRKSGQLEAAAEAYESALVLAPHNTRALSGQAEVASLLGDEETATASLEKLSTVLESGSAEHVRTLTSLGRAHAKAGRKDEATVVWRTVLELRPDDISLRRNLAQLMLSAGLVDLAKENLGGLATADDPETRIAIAPELARLHEVAGEFPEAISAIERGLAPLHFKDWRYAQLLERLFDLHERSGELDALEASLLEKAAPPSEETAFRLSKLYEHQADTEQWLTWSETLVDISGGVAGYRYQLAMALSSADREPEAAAILDAMLAEGGDASTALVFDRCRIDFRQGTQHEAEERLRAHLERAPADRTREDEVLAFARENFLDHLAEDLLRNRLDLEGQSESSTALPELVQFLAERHRTEDAVSLLEARVETATEDQLTSRLLEASSQLLAINRPSTSASFAKRASERQPENRDALLLLGEALGMGGSEADGKAAEQAFERAWNLSQTSEDRQDVDERLLSYLEQTGLGDGTKEIPNPDPRRQAGGGIALSFLDDRAEERPEPASSSGSRAYAAKLSAAATTDDLDRLLRAAWWAFKVDDHRTAYRLIASYLYSGKVDPQSRTPEIERFLLALASASQNRILETRQLERLAKIDPEGSPEYRRRLAEIDIEFGRVERGISSLEALVRDEPEDLAALESLSMRYREQSRSARDRGPEGWQQSGDLSKKALTVWERALRHSEAGTALPIARRYAQYLFEAGRYDEAAALFCPILERESDPRRRDEIYSQQRSIIDLALSTDAIAESEGGTPIRGKLLSSLIARYRELESSHPLDPTYPRILSDLYQIDGQSQEAFVSMRKAYYLSPDAAAEIPALRDAAIAAGDREAAIYFQRQLLFSLPPVSGGDESKERLRQWQELVELTEAELLVEEADKIRSRFERQFTQDPAVLKSILKGHQERGDLGAALRVSQRLQKLQPWNPDLALRTALAYIQSDQSKKARPLLHSILDAEPETDGPPIAYFPLAEPGAEAGSDLEQVSNRIAVWSKIDARLTEKISGHLRALVPYFDETPTEPAARRLRALRAYLQVSEKVDPALAKCAAERLLLAYHQGTEDELLQQAVAFYLTEPNYITYFGAAATCLRAGIPHRFYQWATAQEDPLSDPLRLGSWVGPGALDPPSATHRHLLFLGAFEAMVASGGASVPVAARAGLLDLEDHFSAPDFWSMALALSAQPDFAGALELSAPCAERQTSARFYYAYNVSRYAYFLGDREREIELLRRALEQDFASAKATGHDVFYDAYRRLHAILRTDPERAALQTQTRAELSELTHPDIPARLAFMASLEGDEEGATTHMADYYARAASKGRPGNWNLAYFQPGQTDAWQLLQKHAGTLNAGGLLDSAGTAHLDFARTLALAAGGADDIGYRARNFSQQHLVWKLYDTPLAGERLHLVRQSTDGLSDASAVIELASFLNSQGFSREAAAIYRDLLRRVPSNAGYCEDFLDAARRVGEIDDALAYLDTITGDRRLTRPQGIDDDLIADHHAHFLLSAGQRTKLEGFALSGDPKTSRRQRIGRLDEQIFYLRVLAAARKDDGDLDGAIKAYQRLVDWDSGDPNDTIALAETLVEAGRKAQVIALLYTLADDEEAKAYLPAVLPLLAKAQSPNREQIRKLLARAARLAEPEAVIAIAELAVEVGDYEPAYGALSIAARSTDIPHYRIQLLTEALRLSLTGDKPNPDRARQILDQILRLARSKSTNSLAFLPVLAELDAESADLVATHLAPRLATAAPETCLAVLALRRGEQRLVHLQPATRRLKADRNATIENLSHGAGLLLDQDRPHLAEELWQAIRARGGSHHRLKPIDIRIAVAMKDDSRITEIHQRALENRYTGSPYQRALPKAFNELGRTDLARSLYQKQYGEVVERHATSPTLISEYATLLIELGTKPDLDLAEHLLIQHYPRLPDSVKLVVDLHRAKNTPLDAIADQLTRFQPTSGWRLKVLREVVKEKPSGDGGE